MDAQCWHLLRYRERAAGLHDVHQRLLGRNFGGSEVAIFATKERAPALPGRMSRASYFCIGRGLLRMGTGAWSPRIACLIRMGWIVEMALL